MPFSAQLPTISRSAAYIVFVAMAAIAGCVETMPKIQNFVADFNATAADVQGGWSGTYECGQGKTAVNLYLAANSTQAFNGRFDFGNLPGQNNVSPGSFTLNGVIGNGRVSLEPVRWINRPANYQLVSVQAAFFRGPDRIVGNVKASGCGPFQVTRNASVLASPATEVNASAAAKAPANQASAVQTPISTPASKSASSSGSFLSAVINTNHCSGDELGKVTRAILLDYKQANAVYKKGNGPQIAKPGEIYVQIFARSKAVPFDWTITKVDKRPSTDELASLVGKAQCTIIGSGD